MKIQDAIRLAMVTSRKLRTARMAIEHIAHEQTWLEIVDWGERRSGGHLFMICYRNVEGNSPPFNLTVEDILDENWEVCSLKGTEQ